MLNLNQPTKLTFIILRVNHLSKFELLQFGQRQVICYNPFFNVSLWGRLICILKLTTKSKQLKIGNKNEKRRNSNSRVLFKICVIRIMLIRVTSDY